MTMTANDSGQERRRYPRVQVPIYCRPARLFAPRRPVINIGLGGIRAYSDEAHKIGERLEIELFMPDHTSLECTVRVVWFNPLLEGAPAKYEVGFQFLEAPPSFEQRLAGVLEQHV